MLIGQLADTLGIPTRTVRFYERKGLLPDPERAENGYRVYDDTTLARLRFIRTCLLYTSPSPRDRQKSRMPSSA